MFEFSGSITNLHFCQKLRLANGLVPDKAVVSFSERRRRCAVVKSPEVSFSRGDVGAEWFEKFYRRLSAALSRFVHLNSDGSKYTYP